MSWRCIFCNSRVKGGRHGLCKGSNYDGWVVRSKARVGRLQSRQSAFQGQQRAFTSFDVAWRDLQPTSKDRCHPCACCTVCLRRRHGHHLQGPLNKACSAKISHARKGAAAVVAAAATVEVAKAPLHAHGTTTGILLFLDEKLYACKPMRNCIRFAYKMSDFLCVMTSNGKVKSNVLYR